MMINSWVRVTFQLQDVAQQDHYKNGQQGPGPSRVPQTRREASNFRYEPVREKTNNLGFRPGLTQTRLHSHTIKLEA